MLLNILKILEDSTNVIVIFGVEPLSSDTNIDLTIICELPKILPYYKKMSENISKICDIELEKINVKSTTTEKLGFLGRKEGIAALATSCIIKIK